MPECWSWTSGLATRTVGRQHSGGKCESENTQPHLSIRDTASTRASGLFPTVLCVGCMREMKCTQECEVGDRLSRGSRVLKNWKSMSCGSWLAESLQNGTKANGTNWRTSLDISFKGEEWLGI